MDDIAWDSIDRLQAWLGAGSTLPLEIRRLLQLMKISEETGEVAEAVIGVTGQNPRKGVSHSWEDVQSEVCDVIIASMVALTLLTPDARGVFAERLRRVEERSAAHR